LQHSQPVAQNVAAMTCSSLSPPPCCTYINCKFGPYTSFSGRNAIWTCLMCWLLSPAKCSFLYPSSTVPATGENVDCLSGLRRLLPGCPRKRPPVPASPPPLRSAGQRWPAPPPPRAASPAAPPPWALPAPGPLPYRACYPHQHSCPHPPPSLPSLPHFPNCSAACQEENDATFTKRAGRQYHELNETLRSYLGPLGISTQVQLTVWPVMTQIKLASCFCQPTNGLSS
jgi:hypothetical protein